MLGGQRPEVRGEVRPPVERHVEVRALEQIPRQRAAEIVRAHQQREQHRHIIRSQNPQAATELELLHRGPFPWPAAGLAAIAIPQQRAGDQVAGEDEEIEQPELEGKRPAQVTRQPMHAGHPQHRKGPESIDLRRTACHGLRIHPNWKRGEQRIDSAELTEACT